MSISSVCRQARGQPPPNAFFVVVCAQDDFDIGAEEEANLEVKDRPEVQEKLDRRIRSVEVKILNPPRPGQHSRGAALQMVAVVLCQQQQMQSNSAHSP